MVPLGMLLSVLTVVSGCFLVGVSSTPSHALESSKLAILGSKYTTYVMLSFIAAYYLIGLRGAIAQLVIYAFSELNGATLDELISIQESKIQDLQEYFRTLLGPKYTLPTGASGKGFKLLMAVAVLSLFFYTKLVGVSHDPSSPVDKSYFKSTLNLLFKKYCW